MSKYVQFVGEYTYYLNYLHEKWSKGVSILSDQLPYSLKLILSCPITSNSKAA